MNLLNPEFTRAQPFRADYRLTVMPEQPVPGQPAELGWLQHDVTADLPVHQGTADEWGVSFRLRKQEFETGAVFPQSGEPFPDDLWNVRLGTNYRHRFDSGWIAGAVLTVGSPSDKPFHSGSELDISVTGVLRVPRGERDAWLFFLNYGSNREFLPHVPIPGVGYHYQPSDRFSAVITTGFVSLRYQPVEPLTLTATYTAVRTVDVRATYQIFRPVRIWAGFDWTNDRFLLANRSDDDDRLFYYEKRVRVGLIVGLARQLYVELTGGYTFDRFYFVGEDFQDRSQNRIDVEAGPFAAVRVGARF